MRNWIFSAKTSSKDSLLNYVDLFSASSISIKRHIKIIADATPYDPDYMEYFKKRNAKI